MIRPQILFLISPHSPDGHAVNDNAQTLPKAFRDAGWQVSQVRHRAIHRAPDGLAANGESLANYDLIWPVGFGPRRGFFDWLQLMSELPTRQLINAPAALALKHGKAAWGAYSARHFIAAEAQTLIDVMQAEPGHWVLKPLAGSFGEAVIHLQSNETEAVASEMQKRPGDYFMLQRFLPEIALGETRTLVVAGRIIGSYLRIPTNQLHANLAQHGEARVTDLSHAESTLVKRIAADLLTQHIGFAAIDTVGDTLMEVNIANPGGLGTLNRLYGNDFGPAIVEAAEAFILKN
jgi:glutathione synthase/RimK-type ligase-like ATP-grasp enzyme